MLRLLQRQSALLTLLLLAFLLPQSLSAVLIGGLNYELSKSDHSAGVASNRDYFGDLSIPERVDYEGVSYSVISICERAFEGCGSLTSVEIPGSVTSIGFCAFDSCSGLSSLVIPASVTSIDEFAFAGCSGLKEIILSDGSSDLVFGSEVFDEVNPEIIYVGRNFTCPDFMGRFPFRNKTSIKSLTISDFVTSIPKYAFSGCTGLNIVMIPESVVSIGEYAFSGCVGMTSVVLPRSVSTIEDYTFQDCTSLESINIHEGITSIGDFSFMGCVNLTSLDIPESVTYIGLDAFSDCVGIKEINIREGSEPLKFRGKSFDNVNAETLFLGRNFSADYNRIQFQDMTSLSVLTIGKSVSTIESKAFSGCRGLKELILEDGDQELIFGEKVFAYAEPENIYVGRDFSLQYGYGNDGNPFYMKKSLTTVFISDAVTSIPPYAFYGCSALTSITIPNSVKSIEYGAFANCESIKEVVLEDGSSPLNCSKYVFSKTSFDSLYLGRTLAVNSDRYYYGSPFSGNPNLKSLTIGNSVTSIIENSFERCSGLTNLYIPDSVTEIKEEAFYLCTGLKELNLGKSIVSIEDRAFGSVELDKISSKAVEAPLISSESFSKYSIVASKVGIPDNSLQSYKDKWGFFKCFGAADVSEENTIEVSSPGNLINQMSLDKIDVTTSLKLIGNINGTDLLTLNKFQNLITLDLSEASIVSGGMPYYEKDNERFGTEDNTLGEMWSYNLSSLTWIKLPNTLTTIGENAFYSKDKLLSISIPGSVLSVGYAAFNYCSSLEEIIIEESKSILEFSLSGVFSGTNPKIAYIGRDFSWGTTNYRNSPFYNMTSLASVTIGESVTSLGNSVFAGCTGLKKAIFTSIDALCKIKFNDAASNPLSYAHRLFIGDEEITILDVPESVSSIGDFAFIGYSEMTSVNIPNSVISIGESAFSGCSGLTSVNIPNSVTSIGKSTFSGCSGLTTVNIPNSVISIGESAFSGCSSLKSISMPESVSQLSPSVLYGCENLVSIEIPSSVISIGYFAFGNCERLESITIPNSVTSIGSYAFSNCKKLESVNIPDPLQTISSNTFSGCISLKSVVLPGSLREVAANAFAMCSALEYVKVINPIPPVIESSTFPNESSSILSVAEGSRNIFWIHPYWGKFGTIETWGEDSEMFVADNVTYQVTSEVDRTVEVSAVNLLTRSGDLTIPEEVAFNGKMYRVAGIANSGFENVAISSLSLPSTIGYVGLGAFKGCDQLSQVTCMAFTPPSVYDNSFEETTYNTASLQVPESSVEAYKANDVWGRFNIGEARILVSEIELDPSMLQGREGETYAINATVYPADATNSALQWTSSDESVATVDGDGNVTLLRTGFCTVTARATDGSGVEAVCKVDISTAIGSIDADDDSETLVYDLSGVLLLRTSDTDFSDRLSPGVYIVRRGTTAQKITVN